MINYRLKASNLKLEAKVFYTYFILFIIVLIASVLFGNDTLSTIYAAIITTITVVFTLIFFLSTATTISVIVIFVLKLTFITLLAMFIGVGTGVLTKRH